MQSKLKIALVVILLCLQYACVDRFVEKPTFILKNISLSLQSMKELQALLTVEVNNPNRFSLKFNSLEYRFFFENREAASGVYTDSIELPAASVKEVAIPLTVEFADLGTPLKSLIRGKDVPYRIEGTLHLKVLWGSIAIPLIKEGSLNIHS
ncbi:MAG: LEA type 2 family protein [Syntrophaceae bacterium]|nr:LEA type 2 family protein [Syntrophaceae bacterium]